ncbi:hypothetical protein [Streptomyces sp. NBC_00582]|uniref:hypothetical protein n=1 Tax=Streptomyces sp. NBC_00582 TaxID=2975783 RepID=UPI002E804583|nr:hypothetical protein [Streptomyces sp. NBC_00582]WUB63529.1 hypothetical protein OG852_25630 [Streptomyces sp. NBC_00582]
MSAFPTKHGSATVLAALALVLSATPTHATSAATTVGLPGGNKIAINAWHCAVYVNACDWRASTTMSGLNPRKAQWIQNRAELEAHGVGGSLQISQNPGATLTVISKALAEVRWKNTNASIADTWGQVRPSKTTMYVSTRSCGTAQVTGAIKVSEKCAYAGAS